MTSLVRLLVDGLLVGGSGCDRGGLLIGSRGRLLIGCRGRLLVGSGNGFLVGGGNGFLVGSGGSKTGLLELLLLLLW